MTILTAKVNKKMKMEKWGEYAFLVGVIIAVIAGAVGYANPVVPLALVVLGLVVGFLNISEKETTPFLIAAIALIAAGTIDSFSVLNGLVSGLGTALQGIVDNIAVFVVPGAILVALKAVWALASKK